MSGGIQLRFQMRLWRVLVLSVVASSCGCVADSYRYGISTKIDHSQPFHAQTSNPVAYGQSHPSVDRIEKLVQSPRKFFRRIARRPAIDPMVEEARRDDAVQIAEEYLSANGLTDIYIDVRVYQPREQWARLKSNTDIRPIWKYTGGTVNWLRYTLLPLRAFHTDYFDPFTETLHINSTKPHQALYESANAKEYLSHEKIGVGTYAMLQYVPFVPLYHTAKSSCDVLTYSEHHLDGELSEVLFPLTYSRLGSTAVSEVLSVVTVSPNAPTFTGPLLRVAGGSVGRSTGSTFAKSRKRDSENTSLDVGN